MSIFQEMAEMSTIFGCPKNFKHLSYKNIICKFETSDLEILNMCSKTSKLRDFMNALILFTKILCK